MLLFDLETDGLLDTVSKIHCLVIKNTETGEVTTAHTAPDIELCLQVLQQANGIGGHNIIKYDLPVIQKLYPWFTFDKSKVFDTLVAARLIWSNIKDHDNNLLKKQQIPGRLYGSHSLEAWGYRLKMMKGEYAEEFKARMGEAYEEGMEWRAFSEEMLDYCVQDVEVTHALYDKIVGKQYSSEALELEHQVAWLMAQQERNGFPFDSAKGASLYAKLAQRRGELERELKEFFKFWFAPAGKVVTKKTRKVFHEDPNGPVKRRIKEKGKAAYFQSGHYEEFTEGAEYTQIKLIEFNPASRDHIADRLIKLYGWKPEVFTDGGKPRVDEEVMEGLSYPPCRLLTEYLLVAKRASQLAEGEQAWMKVEKRGKIHGSINPNGAVTGRCTHAYPNIAQVPAVGSPYGQECRELFTVLPGWKLVGSDASGLELRCLAHFMARFDGGKYGKVLLEGDVHWANVQSMDLTAEDRNEEDKLHKVYRDGSKTFIYGFLYGAGDEKAGKIVYGLVLRAKALGLPYKHLLQKFFGGNENPQSADFVRAGKKLKATFLKKTPALKKLIEAVRESAKRGYLIGLDKRHLHVRSAHSALNTLLQSAGALICKYWIVRTAQRMEALGYKHGWDGDFAFVAYVHDEAQVAVRSDEAAEALKEQTALAMKDAEERFNFRCPLACESKVGLNWYETH